jgi:choline dehydrogenase-like flavoprotein
VSHVPFQDKGAPAVEGSFDFVVVGSGAGGAAAAVKLARAGKSVAIVEAGAWREPEDYPYSTYGAMRDLFDDWGTQATVGRALWPIVQARTVGGTTVINSAICVRTPADVFKKWEVDHGVRDVEPRLRALQEELEQELTVGPVSPASWGHSNRLAALGEKKLGWSDPHPMLRYAKDCAGAGQCLQGCRHKKKQSLAVTFIPEVLQRGGTLFSSAPVDKVIFEGTRAVGVKGRFEHPATKKKGAGFVVRARVAVIIAASVTHSPVLLMRSGLKLPALGHFFRSHPGTGVFGLYDEPVDMNLGTTQGWASTAFRSTPGFKLETLSIPPELVASRVGGGGTVLMERLSKFRHLAMWCLACRADTVGRVRRSPFSTRPIVQYELNQTDMLRFREGLVLLSRQHFAAGAKRIIPGVMGLPYDLGPDELRVLEDAPLDPRRYTGVLSHLFGGCVMGTDPARSVVDPQGRVHGVQGLMVVDASVIPTNLGVNPQHTIMSLAQHFAERAVEQVKAPASVPQVKESLSAAPA